jgi:hypothetical protein
MPPLPFNLGIDLLLRRRVRAALYTVPLLFWIAGFVPFVLLDNWLKAEAGIPLWKDISEHPNAAALVPLLSITFVFFPFVGYLLGWIVNAAALTVAGWTVCDVRRAMFHSQVPESWLLQRQRDSEEISKLAAEFDEWSSLRKVGLRIYLVKEGAVKIGLGFFAIMLLVRAFRSDPQLDNMHWASILGWSVAFGVLFAAWIWFWREHRFAYREVLLNWSSTADNHAGAPR